MTAAASADVAAAAQATAARAAARTPSARRPGATKPISGRSRVPRAPCRARQLDATNLVRASRNVAPAAGLARAAPHSCKQPALSVRRTDVRSRESSETGRPASRRDTCPENSPTWVRRAGCPFAVSPERERIRVAGDDLAGNDRAEADERDTRSKPRAGRQAMRLRRSATRRCGHSRPEFQLLA